MHKCIVDISAFKLCFAQRPERRFAGSREGQGLCETIAYNESDGQPASCGGRGSLSNINCPWVHTVTRWMFAAAISEGFSGCAASTAGCRLKMATRHGAPDPPDQVLQW